VTDEPVVPETTDTLYEAWRVEPTPDNLTRVVGSLDKTIGFKLSSMGVANNPQMRHQARLFTAGAVQSFKPEVGSKLTTWAQSQLQSMQRFKREQQGPVKVADRASIDAWTIERTTRELQDELGFEPDVKTLADRSGMSVKRIASVRKSTRPIASSDQMFNEGDELTDFLGEALEYVYTDADPVDRKIIEMLTGYGGVPMLQKKDIALRLGVSASQVTRRSDAIGRKLQEMDAALEKTHA